MIANTSKLDTQKMQFRLGRATKPPTHLELLAKQFARPSE